MVSLNQTGKNNHELLVTSFEGVYLSFYYYINRVTRNRKAFYLPPATTNIEFASMLRLQSQLNDFFNRESEPILNAFVRYVTTNMTSRKSKKHTEIDYNSYNLSQICIYNSRGHFH